MHTASEHAIVHRNGAPFSLKAPASFLAGHLPLRSGAKEQDSRERQLSQIQSDSDVNHMGDYFSFLLVILAAFSGHLHALTFPICEGVRPGHSETAWY